MSASKLEKNIANLERRMREEFHLKLEEALRPCLERLEALEGKLSGNPVEQSNVQIAEKSPQVKKMLGDPVVPKPDESDLDEPESDASKIVPAVELQVKGEPADDAMEPVAFLETTWNLVLVLGHAGVGWIDVLIAWLLLFASAGMQISFVGIILNPFFLGEPFDDRQIETAENWRRSVAHDHTYLDLAQTSLTARVCNGDGSLIISTDQAALIQQINNFSGPQTA